MNTFNDKTVLWAGPEDGLEVEIRPGQLEYEIKGPPRQNFDPTSVITKPSIPELTTGVYKYNSETQRFEWKGYR